MAGWRGPGGGGTYVCTYIHGAATARGFVPAAARTQRAMVAALLILRGNEVMHIHTIATAT